MFWVKLPFRKRTLKLEVNKIVENQLIYSLKEVRMSQLYAVSGQASLEIYIVICASSVPEKSNIYG